jgi:hypothetical protein
MVSLSLYEWAGTNILKKRGVCHWFFPCGRLHPFSTNGGHFYQSGLNGEEKMNNGGIDMNIDRIVFAFAGVMILITLLLSRFHSAYWLWFTAFIGANLAQASFTGFCPLASILKFMGIKSGTAFK